MKKRFTHWAMASLPAMLLSSSLFLGCTKSDLDVPEPQAAQETEMQKYQRVIYALGYDTVGMHEYDEEFYLVEDEILFSKEQLEEMASEPATKMNYLTSNGLVYPENHVINVDPYELYNLQIDGFSAESALRYAMEAWNGIPDCTIEFRMVGAGTPNAVKVSKQTIGGTTQASCDRPSKGMYGKNIKLNTTSTAMPTTFSQAQRVFMHALGHILGFEHVKPQSDWSNYPSGTVHLSSERDDISVMLPDGTHGAWKEFAVFSGFDTDGIKRAYPTFNANPRVQFPADSLFFGEVVTIELKDLGALNLNYFEITWTVSGVSNPSIVSGQGTTLLKVKSTKAGMLSATAALKYKYNGGTYFKPENSKRVYSRVRPPQLSLSLTAPQAIYFDDQVIYELKGLEGKNLNDFTITWSVSGTASPTIVSGQGSTLLKIKFAKEGDVSVSVIVEHKLSTETYPTLSRNSDVSTPYVSSPSHPSATLPFTFTIPGSVPLGSTGYVSRWYSNDPSVTLISSTTNSGTFVSTTTGVKYVYADVFFRNQFPNPDPGGPAGYTVTYKCKALVQPLAPAFPEIMGIIGVSAAKSRSMHAFDLGDQEMCPAEIPSGVEVEWEMTDPYGSWSSNISPDFQNKARAMAQFGGPGTYTIKARMYKIENGARVYSNWWTKHVAVEENSEYY